MFVLAFIIAFNICMFGSSTMCRGRLDIGNALLNFTLAQ
jgi:hypothetical protein